MNQSKLFDIIWYGAVTCGGSVLVYREVASKSAYLIPASVIAVFGLIRLVQTIRS